MTTMIHVELDALCLLLLGAIAWQSQRSVNQQMRRVLFRCLVYGAGGYQAVLGRMEKDEQSHD